MTVTINHVRDAIVATLRGVHPTVKVYDEEIKQGLKLPSFFVKTITVGQSRELDRRYRRMHSFDVHYFGKSNEDCHSTAESLYEQMEYIHMASGILQGNGMNHEVIDSVLHFFVDYNFHVIREAAPADRMQTLDVEVNIKSGN